jgi:hypothetical protein
MNERLSALRLGWWLIGVILAPMLLAGCGATVPHAADVDAARQTLEVALSSWQKGETLEALKTATPSVVVSDRKWSRGDKLTKLELNDLGKPAGTGRAFHVTLWVTDAKGKATKEVAEYSVTTDPVRTVLRAVFD